MPSVRGLLYRHARHDLCLESGNRCHLPIPGDSGRPPDSGTSLCVPGQLQHPRACRRKVPFLRKRMPDLSGSSPSVSDLSLLVFQPAIHGGMEKDRRRVSGNRKGPVLRQGAYYRDRSNHFLTAFGEMVNQTQAELSGKSCFSIRRVYRWAMSAAVQVIDRMPHQIDIRPRLKTRVRR